MVLCLSDKGSNKFLPFFFFSLNLSQNNSCTDEGVCVLVGGTGAEVLTTVDIFKT